MKAKEFKDLKIETVLVNDFTGDKISMKKIMNKKILVHKVKIEPSNYGGNRITMQLELNTEMRIAWSNSKFLIKQAEQMTEDSFPFYTTIIEDNDCYKFT